MMKGEAQTLETQQSQVLDITVSAGDGGGGVVEPLVTESFGDEIANFIHCFLVEFRIADDAALADVIALEFELGLYQADDVAARFEDAEKWRENFCE